MPSYRHFSRTKIKAVRDRTDELRPFYKPSGLWYEVDHDWQYWCGIEMPHWIKGYHMYDLDLASCKILHITSIVKLRAFHRRYMTITNEAIPRLTAFPDWSRVAKRYDGIEISPYIDRARYDLEVHWYYSWDCASGCIWRPKDLTLSYVGKYQKLARQGEV